MKGFLAQSSRPEEERRECFPSTQVSWLDLDDRSSLDANSLKDKVRRSQLLEQ